LDAGELAMIRAEKKESSENQHPARSRVSSETIRYLYRLRTESRDL
jgi:hypothetical protein